MAPLSLRLVTPLAGTAPSLAAAVQRRIGGDAITKQLAEGQRYKR